MGHIKLKSLLNEDNGKHEYGCVMIYYSFPEMSDIHSQIKDEDVFRGSEDDDREYGLETEPHCTLLFGLHEEVTLQQVEDIVSEYTYYTAQLKNASLFENAQYDVLKFEVSADNIHQANKDLKTLPFTTEYPDYNPHLTIGYLKSGTGKKYTKVLKGKEYDVAPQYIIYSTPSGKKHKINIKVD